MVTSNAAGLLKLPEAGRIAPHLPADLLLIPPIGRTPAEALLGLERSRIRLVILGGRPLVGAPELSPVFAARRVAAVPVNLDGEARILDGTLARRIRASSLAEPGLDL